MDGAALAAEREYDLAMIQAWQTGGFVNGGMKNKKLSDFLISDRSTEPKDQAAQAVAFFRNMKEAGFPVEIKRVVH